MKPAPKPKPGAIDPSLRPFIAALARLLADDAERTAAARRALREVEARLSASPSPRRKERPR